MVLDEEGLGYFGCWQIDLLHVNIEMHPHSVFKFLCYQSPAQPFNIKEIIK
jgi:hypothetical protein